jgi:hypothetical protein
MKLTNHILCEKRVPDHPNSRVIIIKNVALQNQKRLIKPAFPNINPKKILEKAGFPHLNCGMIRSKSSSEAKVRYERDNHDATTGTKPNSRRIRHASAGTFCARGFKVV